MTVDDFVARAKQNRHRGLVAKFQNLTPDFFPPGWTHDTWFEFEERAAILEFDGGLSREEAEELALTALRSRPLSERTVGKIGVEQGKNAGNFRDLTRSLRPRSG